jgi:hypothetical protein
MHMHRLCAGAHLLLRKSLFVVGLGRLQVLVHVGEKLGRRNPATEVPPSCSVRQTTAFAAHAKLPANSPARRSTRLSLLEGHLHG